MDGETLFFEMLSDAVVVCDDKRCVLSFNRAAQKLFHLEAPNVVGKSLDKILRVMPPGPEVRQLLGLAYEEDGWTGQLECETAEGLCVRIDWRAQPIDGPDGLRIASVMRNLTPAPEATLSASGSDDLCEQQLIEQHARQAQKMDAVGRLAGGVAHDFNNILTTIALHAELLLDSVRSTSPMHEDLTEIRKAAERATALTCQLLTFSRRQTSLPTTMDLNELIGQSSSTIGRLLGAGVALSFVPGSTVGCVKVGPGQLEQVLANLALNARDAMPSGGQLSIATSSVLLDHRIALRHAVAEGRYEVTEVCDTGCGMNPNAIEHLFEPFFTTKSKGKGTGLGLSTVYGIVRQNRGFVEVESTPAQGTTIRIYLPRAAERLEPS
jgi:signal transduction histidine kinase